MLFRFSASLVVVIAIGVSPAADPVQDLLKKEVISPRQARLDTQTYVDARVPRLAKFSSVQQWQKYTTQLRKDILEKVVLRGEAAEWQKQKTKVQWLDAIPGGEGYRIRKLRYEAVPGLWIPALLYEPEKLSGKVPVVMNVNGHDGKGKVAPYKQIRCINQAKRGMLALNVEWLGMGQLRVAGLRHARMNQLDLCGTSGLAPFYLSMKRGLDVLLSHKNADPKRVAVAGLSGGGWQTIFISALDERVMLSNPVAGYSSFRTRAFHHKDLGDSEQTPSDLATLADYTHLTALRAPRPTLLTYNAKDNCCFEAGYALPPLLKAAKPFFRLYGEEKSLRSHVNEVPGDHNFGQENREALYQMIGDHFYPGDKSFNAKEIAVNEELKTAKELEVKLPRDNGDFQKLAMAISQRLPLVKSVSGKEAQARKRLQDAIQMKQFKVKAEPMAQRTANGIAARYWKLRLDKSWTVPVVELWKGTPKKVRIVIADQGRVNVPKTIEELLDSGCRVFAVDLWYFGESKMDSRAYLFGLILQTIGDRPLGLQAGQLRAVARWAQSNHKQPVEVVAVGMRSSTIALVCAALETKAIGGVTVSEPLSSLKEIITKNYSYEQAPEHFCFGLLKEIDIPQIKDLVKPRDISVRK